MGRKKRFGLLRLVISLCIFAPVTYSGYEMYQNLEEQGLIGSDKDMPINKDGIEAAYKDATADMEAIKKGVSSGEMLTQEELDEFLDSLGEEVDTSEFSKFMHDLMTTLGVK